MQDFQELKKVVMVMNKFSAPWFICGGWAIDLAVGKKTREHTDIDIGIFREDQLKLREYLSAWRFQKIAVNKQGAFNLDRNEYIELPEHELRAVKDNQIFEILLNEFEGNDWAYRRNRNVKLPKKKLIKNGSGIPYWAPEVSLLFKSKETREKDEQDFKIALPLLNNESRTWLKKALQLTKPSHSWIKLL